MAVQRTVSAVAGGQGGWRVVVGTLQGKEGEAQELDISRLQSARRLGCLWTAERDGIAVMHCTIRKPAVGC